MNTLMTIQQVAKATSLSRTTIWRMQQRGDFPKGIKISDARVAYPVTEIDAWIANRITGGQPTAH